MAETNKCPHCGGQHPAVYVDIVFDGSPERVGGKFVGIQNQRGEPITCGYWVNDGDIWRLRIPPTDYYKGLA